MTLDYKKILTSRKFRIKILSIFNFIPDSWMVRFQYWIKTGRKLNLKNPKRYTEKLQWYKVYYRDELMKKCTDKYEVRKYVEDCGLGNILNECYGVYDSVESIEWNNLPKSFVIKDTLGGGGNSVIIIKDKSKMNFEEIKDVLNEWVKSPINKKHPGREWVYDYKKHRIVIEKYIESDVEKGGLIDYKFLCFSGHIELLYILADRKIGEGAGCGFFDMDFNQLPYTESDEPKLLRKIEKPSNFEEMKKIAEKLSKPFPCARIDLYNEKQKILFGEITFFDGSGYMFFTPDEVDFILGEKFNLKGIERN